MTGGGRLWERSGSGNGKVESPHLDADMCSIHWAGEECL